MTTIAAGLQCLAAGETLLIRGGTYDESISAVPSGTSWDNKTRVAAYPGETVWLKPLSLATSAGGNGFVLWLDGPFQYIEFDGLNLDGTAQSNPGVVLWISTNNGNDPNHIRFQNAEVIAPPMGGSGAVALGAHSLIGATGSNQIINVKIHGGGLPGGCGFMCASYGIYIAGPNNLVDKCEIYDTSGAFIQVFNADGDSPDANTIRNTTMHDLSRAGGTSGQEWGILVAGNNNAIYNNLIYNISVADSNPVAAAINITPYDGNMIYNNTVYNNVDSGIYVSQDATSTQVINNIVYRSGGADFTDSGTGTRILTNLFGMDPHFVDPSSSNFQLAPGSPAIGAGTSLPVVTTDITGFSRGQLPVDIGAYQSQGQSNARRRRSASTPAAPTDLKIIRN
ncbi:MAG TPA: right-handed parallel beta-helix repeat-containing protein [Vicinamibacterales bacterium]|nr:right-handed parallel beta-helix repeat-containing protein [Vicinamibacterales bacterium]